ncbi:MAG: hypothetical protein IJ833_07650 [Lachnospiraceae bacterium]|nr:hypothetical protein [Lachnospiraceae bacterium]
MTGKKGWVLLLLMTLFLCTACQKPVDADEVFYVEPETGEADENSYEEDGTAAGSENVCINLPAAPKMLMLNDHLYVDTGETDSMPGCGNLDFAVECVIAEGEIPTENGQVNFQAQTGYTEGYGGQYSWRQNRVELPIEGNWHIFAYNENNLEGISMTVLDNTDTWVKVAFTGDRAEEVYFGDDYLLERLDEETGEWSWVPIVFEGDWGYNDIAYRIPQGEAAEWETQFQWLYGRLPAGTYRIVKEVGIFTDGQSRYEKYWYSAVFEV